MDEVVPDQPSAAGDKELGEKEQNIKMRFLQLQAPIQERKRKLQSSKQVHQLHRDLADEIVRCGLLLSGSSFSSYKETHCSLSPSKWILDRK